MSTTRTILASVRNTRATAADCFLTGVQVPPGQGYACRFATGGRWFIVSEAAWNAAPKASRWGSKAPREEGAPPPQPPALCEVPGFLRELRVAFQVWPSIPRAAFIAAARSREPRNVRRMTRGLSPLDIATTALRLMDAGQVPELPAAKPRRRDVATSPRGAA